MRLDANNNRVNVDEDEINEDQVMILDRRCQVLLICSKDAKTWSMPAAQERFQAIS